ncbi:MAG: hypothetical protein ACOC1U_06700 [Spirochaetota bacterium]
MRQPFESTGGQENMGLGLSIVESIAARHDAAFVISSGAGFSTVARLAIPLAR